MGRDLFASRIVLRSAQMRALENLAIVGGLASGASLMERAGRAVTGEITRRWPKAGRVTVLCGPGNNGGDGYVIARLLLEAGWQLRVLGLEGAAPADAAGMRDQWRARGAVLSLSLAGLQAEATPDLYVDAIFGTGLSRPVTGEMAAILRELARRVDGAGAPPLVAVDGPSGLCLDSGVNLVRSEGDGLGLPRAQLTVTFDSPRPGHLLELGPAFCGDLVVGDIGLAGLRGQILIGQGEPPLARMGGPSFAREEGAVGAGSEAVSLLAKTTSGHKFTYGHVLVLAGGSGQGGAARLSAKAALRIGAGLVTLAPPSEALSEHARPPDALMRIGIDRPEELQNRLSDPRISAIVLGPGCGIARAAQLLPVVLASERNAVLDADALTAMAQRPNPLEGLHPGCVLTPHFGEFARIFPDLAARLNRESPHIGPIHSRLDVVAEAAARAGCTVLLKGADSVIAAPGAAPFILASSYDAAAPWLATAGAGDVLAGLIAGLLARKMAASDAARMGATLHSAAARTYGPGLIADDLPEQIPLILRDLFANAPG